MSCIHLTTKTRTHLLPADEAAHHTVVTVLTPINRSHNSECIFKSYGRYKLIIMDVMARFSVKALITGPGESKAHCSYERQREKGIKQKRYQLSGVLSCQANDTSMIIRPGASCNDRSPELLVGEQVVFPPNDDGESGSNEEPPLLHGSRQGVGRTAKAGERGFEGGREALVARQRLPFSSSSAVLLLVLPMGMAYQAASLFVTTRPIILLSF